MTMTELPAPTATVAPELNRIGTVTFSSDRPDLTNRSVQVVYRSADRTAEVWSHERELLYRMSDAYIAYESVQRTVKTRPTWAIVLAVLGAIFFLLGLLFLLVTKTTYVPTNTVRFTDPSGRALIVSIR